MPYEGIPSNKNCLNEVEINSNVLIKNFIDASSNITANTIKSSAFLLMHIFITWRLVFLNYSGLS